MYEKWLLSVCCVGMVPLIAVGQAGINGTAAGQAAKGIGVAKTASSSPMLGVTPSAAGAESNVNHLDVDAEVKGQQGGRHAISGFTGAASVPPTATVHQANGIMGIIEGQSPSTYVVGGYFQARTNGNHVTAWGSNPLCATTAGFTGQKCIGEEIDVNGRNSSDTLWGLLVTGAWSTPPATTDNFAIGVGKNAIGQWTFGFTTQAGTAKIGLGLGPELSGAASSSQPIELYSKDSQGRGLTAAILADASGNLRLEPAKGSASGAAVIAEGGLKVAGPATFQSPLELPPAYTVAGRTISQPSAAGTLALTSQLPLRGTTGPIGGSVLRPGTCATGTAHIQGATSNMVALATPVTFPGQAFL